LRIPSWPCISRCCVAADGPLYTLPEKFLVIRKPASAASSEEVVVSSEEAA